MSLTLRVCGSAGVHPGPDQACSSYLVAAGETRLLMDVGNGSLTRLQQTVDVADLDAVLLSHTHPDHCVDLYGLYFARRFHPEGPTPLTVYAPAGSEAQLAGLLPESAQEGFRGLLRFVPVAAGDTVTVGALTVRLHEALHPVETVAARIEADGRTLAYSADTAPCDGVIAAARDADLFLCEATWREADGPHPEGVHCSGREAGELAERAGADRLLLTHIIPTVDSREIVAEATEATSAPVAAAADGLEVRV